MIVTIIIIGILLQPLVVVYINIPSYKHYKKAYKILLTKEPIHRSDNQFWWEEGVVWFLDDGEFKIAKDIYMWATYPLFLDPYQYYWHRKFVKAAKRWL